MLAAKSRSGIAETVDIEASELLMFEVGECFQRACALYIVGSS